jgi:hypothetical protein
VPSSGAATIAIPGASLLGSRIVIREEESLTKYLKEDWRDIRIVQGDHANCYFWAAIDRMLHQPEGRRLLEQVMVKQELDRETRKLLISYRFPTGKTVEFERAEIGCAKNGQKPAQVPEILQGLELAYMKLSRERRNRLPWFRFPKNGEGYTGLIANYGFSYEPLQDMFGGTPFMINTSWRKHHCTPSDTFSDVPGGIELVRRELAHIERNPDYLYLMTAGTRSVPGQTYTTLKYPNGHQISLLNNHAYSIRRVNLETDSIMIADPTDNDKTYVLTVEAFCKLFRGVDGIFFPKKSSFMAVG